MNIIECQLFKGDDFQRRSSYQPEESCISDRAHDKLHYTEGNNVLSVESPDVATVAKQNENKFERINVLAEIEILARETSV